MLTSLSLIFLVGLAMAGICLKLKLPRIIGMLITGVILGPFVLDLLDPSILGISSELRKMALIIILIKAGLSLNLRDLKSVGRPALLLSFLPASFELLAFFLFAPSILGITRVEACVMGAVLSAVSPAVVVPRMIELMEKGYGEKNSVPQMLLAGASLDDVYVIVLFETFISMAQGNSASPTDLLRIPISILSGIILGAIFGVLLAWFFEAIYSRQSLVRNSTKVIVILGSAFLLVSIEEWLKGIISISGLIAVMSMSLAIAMKSVPKVTGRLKEKFGKLWLGAEVILFVLVGAEVDIRFMLSAGLRAVLMIFLGLALRSLGVYLALVKTKLSKKEKLFCVISYLPKATVQAAISSIPLALGLPCGKMVLSVAVLAIIITAPLGAMGIDYSHKRLLEKR